MCAGCAILVVSAARVSCLLLSSLACAASAMASWKNQMVDAGVSAKLADAVVKLG